jgi:DNA-directed RNA polymerase specialized sigma subunit
MVDSVDQRLDEIEVWDARQQRITSALHPTSFIGSANKADPRNDYIAAVDRIGDKIKVDIIEIEDHKAHLEEVVDKLNNFKLKNIIRNRYFNGLSWPEVADKVHLSLQHTFRLHGKALEILREILKDESN